MSQAAGVEWYLNGLIKEKDNKSKWFVFVSPLFSLLTDSHFEQQITRSYLEDNVILPLTDTKYVLPSQITQARVINKSQRKETSTSDSPLSKTRN